MKFEINSRSTGSVLFSLECGSLKLCVEAAVNQMVSLQDADLQGAYLRGAYLQGADLRSADLQGADLRSADLQGADLQGADLQGAYLRGAYLQGAYLQGADLRSADKDISLAGPDQSIINLDKVRAIILDQPSRLNMGHWHGDETSWKDKSCAEEAVCGTTHCLAGWLQVCTDDPKLRTISAQSAGFAMAPVAAKMFFRDDDEVMKWLKDRDYVADVMFDELLEVAGNDIAPLEVSA